MSLLNLNYFELFNLPVTTEINLSELETSYLKLQSKYHPDKYVNATKAEKNISALLSTRINDGYKTLADLVNRIEYILLINEYNFDESKTFNDKQFLLEQIKINETINSNDKGKSQELKRELSEKISTLRKDIESLISKKDFENIYNNLSKIRFYKKQLGEISKKWH